MYGLILINKSMSTPVEIPIVNTNEENRVEISNKRKKKKKAARKEKIAMKKELAKRVNKVDVNKSGAYNTKAMTRQKRNINQARRDNH